MKVLFHLLDAGVGGGQRVAANVAHALVERGHEIGLMVPQHGPAVERFPPTTVHELDLRSLRRTRGVLSVRALLRNHDVLYSHVGVPGVILGEAAARLARRPHVVHQHARPHFSANASVRLGQRTLFRAAARRPQFVAVAPHIAGELRALGVPSGAIHVVPNGVDIPDAPEHARDGALAIGVLARIDPGKGLDTFLAAARHVDNARFVVGAAGGAFPEFEAGFRSGAADVGVEIVERPDGERFLAALDVVVLPSLHEGSPLVLLEAMALGKPVVASAIPGVAEVLGEAGVLIPPRDSSRLAEALVELRDDPARRERLGRAAREVIEARYRLDSMLDRAVALLESAVGR